MSDTLFLWIMLSVIFSNAAAVVESRWERIVCFTAAGTSTAFAIVALVVERI